MTKFSNAAIAALIGASIAAAVPAASTASTVDRGLVRVRVSTSGLDLSTAAGRETLEARVRQAGRRACWTGVGGLDGMAMTRRCMNDMMADARVQVAALDRSKTQLASTR